MGVMCVLCLCVRNNLGEPVLSFHHMVLEMKLRIQGLAASIFTHWPWSIWTKGLSCGGAQPASAQAGVQMGPHRWLSGTELELHQDGSR